ncbi:BLUF domain-containing protein [Palleronia sp. KMU-117]|uniref:BLUF domain-containing protein n=1 Tax=Palleronia sp. KMU-117 TaxID=3434108 RepID=UPI003D745872
MGLLRIIYSSQPFGFDEGVLAGILLDARRCNTRDGVTGALICRRDVFVQLLEGPERQVRDAFARISRDDRHVDIVMHLSEPVSERLFGQWAMLHDPARSWFPDGTDASGDGLDRVRAANLSAVFKALAAESQAGPID